ncbi:DNA-binding protein [Mesorhizobium sp. M0814]|uniref:DNA-binding protein n=1 Tax=Mesorhizobium sp. M0814 TaxID=2957004 RepID=UPI00333D4B7A
MANDISTDLLWGADASAKAIGRSERATFHLLEKGEIPAKKVGGRWVANRDKLLEYLTGGDVV